MPRPYPFEKKEREKLRQTSISFETKDPFIFDCLKRAQDDVCGKSIAKAGSKTEVVSFTLAKILLGVIENNELNKSYAERKAKFWKDELNSESLTILVRMARDDFGMDVKIENDPVLVHFTDYLLYKKEGTSKPLIRTRLKKGFIAIRKEDLCTMIGQAIENDILKSIPTPKDLPKEIISAANEIKGEAIPKSKVKKRTTPKIKSLKEDALPPCIKDIIISLESGKSNHNANFVLVTFLIGLGLDNAGIIDIYRRSPKFNEKMTETQVRFALQRKYTCPACKTIKSYGLCTGKCEKGHPEANYIKNAFRKKKAPEVKNG